MIKPGYKTSELYVTLFGVGAILWNNIQAQCHFTTWDILIIGGAVVSYVLGRSGLKIVSAWVSAWLQANQNTK